MTSLWRRPMGSRDASEEHRASTPLELLYDLCFVVAIGRAASLLHHAISHGDAGYAVVSYVLVFFAIWWAWMNFTWFASAYDNDDVVYRVLVFVQMTGVLILAAGVPVAFDVSDLRAVTVC
jgi:low temperature requirement protein LtrA